MTGPGSGADPRVREAERLLESRGLVGVRVEVAGHEREIASVLAPHGLAARIAELAPEIKALGFRYVALDLNTGEVSA